MNKAMDDFMARAKALNVPEALPVPVAEMTHAEFLEHRQRRAEERGSLVNEVHFGYAATRPTRGAWIKG